MIQFRTAIYSGLLASVLGLGACSMMPHASSVSASLSGASEVPANTSAATGSLDASLNKDTHVLSWTVTYAGLSGPTTGGHFHGPAMAGQNAGVVVPLGGSLASPIKGMATLTAAQESDLMAGKWYLNLHTAAHPGGEIRGQVTFRP
ncbi:CHRD domain-containing protein [Rhodoferax sp. UBA5149]|uniref:CHRD domain-containing protein n=1 Tax=Rhodoferax sp. UBA5149 TaxID=1947379 RepID=UPI0025F0A1D2|nr:CHRD domain-containing protein [Rhodoferax sp. UBA5149]